VRSAASKRGMLAGPSPERSSKGTPAYVDSHLYALKALQSLATRQGVLEH